MLRKRDLRISWVTISNNDLDENPYTVYLTGTGLRGPEKIIEAGSELTLVTPNGGERLLITRPRSDDFI